MKMHPDELDIDAALVRRLLAEQFPDWADLPLEPVGPRGTDNRLFRLGDDMVVRLPCRERTVEVLERERKWLPRLAPHLPLDVPAPLAVGRPGEGYPWTWSVFRWLEGENALDAPVADLAQAANDLASFIAALQRIDPSGGPRAREGNFLRGAPLRVLEEAVRARMEILRGKVDEESVTLVWETALRAPDWDRPPVWVHGDLDARNLLVRERRLAAVVDFGCLGVGDPACDVAVPGKSSRVKRATPSGTHCRPTTRPGRGPGAGSSTSRWALSYYTVDSNPTLFTEARRWLAEVLAD